jgi:hypothetical protein
LNPDRESLYRALSNGAWGYLFLNFDLNIGTVSVTPRFVGWLLLVAAIRDLSPERRDLALLRPLALLLAAWSGADWLLSWVHGSVGGHILFLDLLVAAAAIYFHFQFLTDLAALAQLRQPEGGSLDRRLRRRRTVYILLTTGVSVLTHLSGERYAGFQGYAALGLSAAALITALCIMAGVFELRGLFREEQPQA